jgi:hypothetical protein
MLRNALEQRSISYTYLHRFRVLRAKDRLANSQSTPIQGRSFLEISLDVQECSIAIQGFGSIKMQRP